MSSQSPELAERGKLNHYYMFNTFASGTLITNVFDTRFHHTGPKKKFIGLGTPRLQHF